MSFKKETNNQKNLSDSDLQWHEELIEGCKRRDRVAQTKLYGLYADAMYNIAYRIVGNTHDAEDVLVRAFTDVFRAIDSYDRRATPGAWIKRIVVNRAITTIKKRRNAVLLTAEVPDQAEEMIHQSDIDFDLSELKKCMSELAEGYKTVLTLYLIEGYDHGEIAQILGITEATSKSQYSRAKKKLRELILQTQMVK